MKYLIATMLFFLFSCQHYNSGKPIIVKKERSLIPGIYLYTYDGYGKESYFEDSKDKYDVGDTIKGKLK